jgi:hypothetical protein
MSEDLVWFNTAISAGVDMKATLVQVELHMTCLISNAFASEL